MTTPLDAIPVLVPLLNPNEPEALVNLSIQEGDYVKHGIVLHPGDNEVTVDSRQNPMGI
jgi:hypothetical protein